MTFGAGGSHNKQVELVDPVMGEVISATNSEDKWFSPMLRSHATTDSTYHYTLTPPTLPLSLYCLTTMGGAELQTATRTTGTTSLRFLFLAQFFPPWPKTTSSRLQMRTLREASSLLLDPGWATEVQTTSGEAGTVPPRMVHSVRFASFPGRGVRYAKSLSI